MTIPKNNLKTTDINKVLVELEQHVFNELEFKIKLVVKPMLQGFGTSIVFNKPINNNNNNKIIKDDNEGENKF